MIANMPKYASAPIKNYLETGNFKDHEKFPMENDQESKAEVAEMVAQSETFIAADNTKDDMDKRPGVIETTDDFFGPVHAEYVKSDDGKSFEMFYEIGNDQFGATIYTRNTPESLDVITVSPHGGGDDGVMHHSYVDPDGSFMTLKPQND